MKPINKLIAVLSALLLAASCSDRPDDLLFKDFFVSIQDEDGKASSRVLASSNNLVMTYYFQLVSEQRSTPLKVDFEVIVGDGLTKGVDYELQRDIRSIEFEPGVYKKPFRINFLSHAVDASKDNTITIRITGVSDSDVTIGYPGPSAKYSSHTIEKYN